MSKQTKKLKKSTEKNVFLNDDKTGYVLQMPHGKTRNYKRLNSAEGAALITRVYVNIPDIITANTYFWQPHGAASGRRSNENRRQSEINDFCSRVNVIPTVFASGEYSESCKNVYKTMTYKVNDKTTNITGLIGECARWGMILEK
jgi:hypothetical protein